jgi:hypothetical protein
VELALTTLEAAVVPRTIPRKSSKWPQSFLKEVKNLLHFDI